MRYNHHQRKLKSKRKELLKRRVTKYIRFQDRLNEQLSKEMDAIFVQTHKLCCPVCESEWRKIGKSKQTRAAKKAIRDELKASLSERKCHCDIEIE